MFICIFCGAEIDGRTDDNFNIDHSEIQCSSCGKWMTDVTSEACAAVARHVLFRTGGKDEAVVVTENGKPKYEIKVIEIGG